MTTNQLETPSKPATVPPLEPAFPADLTGKLKYNLPTDADMTELSMLRSSSTPWKDRGEKPEDSLEALTKLRPFLHVGKFDGRLVGYVSVERDGPVPGAAYMRNIVVRPELRKKGVGMMLLDQSLQVARDMNRKTLALRVDPANAAAVAFYRKAGFTTVATVTSKKSGKLRLLMSREL